jgi:hypothetical protein
MAVNIFKNITANLTTSGATVYTTPAGYSGIVLMAQLSNITANSVVDASMFVDKSGTKTSLVTDFAIPANDAAGVLSGKLVLEAGQAVFASAGANASIQLTLSILESQN